MIATYRHGKGFLVSTLIFGFIMLGMAGFVLYLGTILPGSNAGSSSQTRAVA
ncbi:hypothetical protein [Pseudomonas fluorescens]|uniref:hypothetical protein n=1 Tax=Pseudomonas fluorescens TaxID=294 RepID=UPI001CD52EF1|nr:hypothetical protein [Pseudomonas fluorescens]